MANFDGYGKAEEVVLSSFGGLNRTGPMCGGKQSFELRNMRLLSDGTLMRREGYMPLISMENSIRGVFYVKRNNVSEAYAVASSEVYYLQLDETGCTPRLLGSIDSAEGEVQFFCYDRKILLLDGQEIWTLDPDGIQVIQAYVPLYGKDWNYGDDGSRTVYERPNMLSNRLRIRFCPQSLTADYYFGELPITAVHEVYVNGKRYTSPYTLDGQKRIVRLSNGYSAGTVVEMTIQVEDGFCGDRASVVGATHIASIGDVEDEKVLLYGGCIPTGSIRMNRKMDADERKWMRKLDENICMLYLTDQDTLVLGDGLHEVTGACRHYDRSLIFTENGTWMADGTLAESGMLRLIPINTALGCSSTKAYAVTGNEPITVIGRRILRWNSKTDERNECNAEVISSEIEPLLAKDFGTKTAAFADTRRAEVWFYTPDEQGRILIWSEQNKCWTSFDGFTPKGMFAFDDRIGFFKGKTMFVFDSSALCDVDEFGETHGIEAELMSSFLDFGHAGRVKRVLGVTVIASCGQQYAEAVLQHVRGHQRVIPLRGDGSEVSVLQARGNSGRFRYLRFGVRCSDVGPWRLHGVRLTVR